MTDIGKGDWVQCIDLREQRIAFHGIPPASDVLKLNAVYYVEKAGSHPIYGPLIWLQDVEPSMVGGYCLWRFRPLGGDEAALSRRVFEEV